MYFIHYTIIYFFYIGSIFKENRDKSLKIRYNLTLMSIAFLSIFFIGNLILNYLSAIPNNDLLFLCFRKTIRILIQSSYTIIGVALIYLSTLKYVSSTNKTNSNKYYIRFIKPLAPYCFYVYLLHQFILIFLYYHTNLTIWCNNLILPWFGFSITFIISIIGSILLRRTHIIKLILG